MSSYAVYQIGHVIFGVGATPDAARADAAAWMDGGAPAAAAVPMYRRGQFAAGAVVVIPCTAVLAAQVEAQGGADGFMEVEGGLYSRDEWTS